MAFAEKLVAVRRAHNLTQDQLAEKLYVTRQAVSRWERGEVTPGIDMMKLIALATRPTLTASGATTAAATPLRPPGKP